LTRPSEGWARLTLTSLSWEVALVRPVDGRCGCVPSRDLAVGDAGCDTKCDPADHQGSSEGAERSLVHGFAGSPRSTSRACSYSSAVISPLAKR